MKPNRVTIYRDPSYPDRLSLTQAALRDRQPRNWLRPALAAALAATLGAGLMGCPKKAPETSPPAGPTTEQPGDTIAAGNSVAPGDTAVPMMLGVVAPPAPITEEMAPRR